MRALSLFVVFFVAKLAVVGWDDLAASGWSAIAFLWQDALVALLFGLYAKRWLYWGLAGYAAAIIPVGRALATPLTWPMLRAAGGPLTDSLLLYATPANVLLVVLTLATGAILPAALRRSARLTGHLCAPRDALSPQRPPQRDTQADSGRSVRRPRHPVTFAAIVAVVVAALGPMAAVRVDTRGLERNAIVALVASSMPKVAARHADADWRVPPFEAGTSEGLTRLHGMAHGRHVVLISLESTAAQYLPVYGAADDVAPNLTMLARDALVFEHAYAAYPESIKGLFSILCSTFPAFDLDAGEHARLPCRALPAVLAADGYRTGLFHSGRFGYLGMDAIVRGRGYQTLADAGDITGEHHSSFGIDEPSTVARMLEWIDAGPRDRPFFLTYLPIAGHHPYETPARGVFPGHDERGRYRNALRYGDAALGALAAGLRERHLLANTLWIVLGDHGEAFGQHAGNYGHTFALFDENVRVPFVIAAPGLLDGQTRIARVVSLVDTAPTILDLLGLDVPAHYQGGSMLDGVPRLALFLTDYSRPLAGLRDGRWKLVYELDARRPRLFDLAADPGETQDLSRRLPDRVDEYTRRLEGWAAAQKDYITARIGDDGL